MVDLKTWTIGGNTYNFADVSARADIETLKNGSVIRDVSSYYLYPNYEQGVLNNDGTVNTAGTGYVTEMLPVIAGEMLVLNSNTVPKVSYYDGAGAFISLVTTAGGLAEYVVPNKAAYAIYQVIYNNGTIAPLCVRYKKQPENHSFSDLILSPIKSNVCVAFTGDSNTVGYGLSDTTNSWANLFGAELAKITEIKCNIQSPWVECLGVKEYNKGYNFIAGSQFTIWTDAEEIILTGTSYSSAWDWYVDGVPRSGASTMETIALDGELHKITVKFTAGQMANPTFTIPKTITFTNSAVSGVGLINVPVPDASTADWLLVMIGTNNRSGGFDNYNNSWNSWSGRGTYIIPAPNHKTDDSYTHSQMLVYAKIANNMKSFGLDVLNVSATMGGVFLDNTLYQSDLIHYNENGHKVIANIVSGALGLPCYFATE